MRVRRVALLLAALLCLLGGAHATGRSLLDHDTREQRPPLLANLRNAIAAQRAAPRPPPPPPRVTLTQRLAAAPGAGGGVFFNASAFNASALPRWPALNNLPGAHALWRAGARAACANRGD